MRRAFLCLLSMSFAGLATAADFRLADESEPYQLQQDRPCLSETDRAAIKERLRAQRERLREAGIIGPVDRSAVVLYQWPLAPRPGFPDFGYHGISNFVDQDPDFPDELLDYNCGDRTYDLEGGYNHQGVDMFTTPFSWLKMDNGDVRIVAAADGVILDKFDGNDDRSCDFGGSWNAVYVEHADGSVAWYGHMKNGSTTYKEIGESVSAGEYLGVVGSSGSSTGPHLHLESYDADGNLIEPYAGPCNMMNDDSWWASQRPYYDSAINALLTHSMAPDYPPCPDQETPNTSDAFMPGQAIRFSAYYRDQLDPQVTTYTVLKPDDSVQWTWMHDSDADHYSAVSWSWNDVLPGDAPTGTWTFRAEYEGQTYNHPFRVCDDPGGDPTVDCPSPITVECVMHGGAPDELPAIDAFLNGATGSGPCDQTLSFTNDGPAFFPLGTTTVTFTGTDDFGQETSCSSTVTVEDTTDPVITCPSDITVECTQHGGTPDDDPAIAAFLAGASATDICDPNPAITHDGPPVFPLGTTVVTFTATDASGNDATCTASVTVEDTTPPTIDVTLSQTMLWPPNHKMVDITAIVEVEDICDPNPTFELVSIESNEPDNGLGDGDFPDDIQGDDLGTDDVEFQLRAERAGPGDGRIYTINYLASDMSGNTTPATVEVEVPHDQSGAAMAGRGFTPDGTDFEGAKYTLVIPGSAELDVTRIDVSRVHVINDMGAVLPLEHRMLDFDGDGNDDLEVSFDAAATLVFARDPEALQPASILYPHDSGVVFSAIDIFALAPVVAVDEMVDTPVVALMRPIPNPFNDRTRVAYEVPEGPSVSVEIAVYDVGGRRVRELVNAIQAPGVYDVTWDRRADGGQSVSPGIYYLKQSTRHGLRNVARLIVIE